jgi:hypothetical protein
MSRYALTVESSAALAANTCFANVVAGASANFKLRRVTIGVRVSGAATSQQTTVYLTRATGRGTASTTTTGIALDPRSRASGITGIDSAWSGAPTLAQATAPGSIMEWTINLQSAIDYPVEAYEEWICDQGTANGLAFVNGANALPSGYLYTLGVEWEE